MIESATTGAIGIDTLRQLARPKRAIPIAIMSAALIIAESARWVADGGSMIPLGTDGHGHPFGISILAVLMCSAFVIIAPVSWRVIRRTTRSPVRQALAYGAVGSATVLILGLGVPAALEWPSSWLTGDANLPVSISLFLIGGWGLGRDIDLEQGVVQAERHSAALARQLDDARLLALRHHLEPHFLYNTLSAIAEWCVQDPEVAEQAVVDLATLLRTLQASVTTSEWTLGQEMALVERYFALFRLRDADRYRVEITVRLEDTHRDLSFPPLLTLPIVENALTHGVGAGYAGETRISWTGGERMSLTVENPGVFTGEREGGLGLDMVRRRSELAWPGAARFHIATLGDKTRAELEWPCRL